SRVDAGLAQPGDEHQVALGLAHLLAVQTDHAGVDLCARPAATQGAGVRGAHLVVREAQVTPTALQVELGAQGLLGDHGALDVPAGPSGAEHPAVPVRLT